MTQLLLSVSPASRRSMRLIVLEALILFSVLCTGLHVPAAAHSDHDAHEDVSVHMADAHFAEAQGDNSDDSSPDQTHDRLHHHHCPSAMMVVGNLDEAASVLRGRSVLHPGKFAALLSRVSEPLTEPPLA